jgi:outer membrane receptor protein involved in Fe transport
VNVLEALGSDLGVGSFYLSEPIEPRIDHGLFLQNSQQIWDSLKAIAGIRYTTSNYQGSISVDPRLSFIWQPAESSSLKLTYGEGFRAPALYESGILDDETEATPPLQMQMVDLNYSQQIKLGGSKITNTASLYWMNSSTNFVQEEDADEPGSYSLVPESDPFQVIGFEDQVKFDFGRFKGFLGGRYIAPEKSVLDGGSKTYIKDVPLMKAKVGVSYQLLSHLELSAFVDHWSSVDTEAPTADGTGTEVYTVPAWTVVSTNIGLNQFKWNSMVGRFNINIENLFDTPYYHANIRGGRPLQFLQAPRTIRAQLTINI